MLCRARVGAPPGRWLSRAAGGRGRGPGTRSLSPAGPRSRACPGGGRTALGGSRAARGGGVPLGPGDPPCSGEILHPTGEGSARRGRGAPPAPGRGVSCPPAPWVPLRGAAGAGTSGAPAARGRRAGSGGPPTPLGPWAAEPGSGGAVGGGCASAGGSAGPWERPHRAGRLVAEGRGRGAVGRGGEGGELELDPRVGDSAHGGATAVPRRTPLPPVPGTCSGPRHGPPPGRSAWGRLDPRQEPGRASRGINSAEPRSAGDGVGAVTLPRGPGCCGWGDLVSLSPPPPPPQETSLRSLSRCSGARPAPWGCSP